jgi:hypothetical protein
MPLAAERHADDIGVPVGELYSYQFALVPDEGIGFPGYTSRTFGRRRLLHCPKLEVAVLNDLDGAEIGYCLGIAVDADGNPVRDGTKLGASLGSPGFWEAVEAFATGLAGRWLILLRSGEDARVFGDAAGMYNCVYDPVLGGVGSTLLMSLMRDIEDSREVDFARTMSEGMRMPFGRTRDAHARRLAVNHYLRLDDWTETRFWPPAGAFEEVEPGGEADFLVAIRDRLAAVFAGIVTTVPSAIGVSGGFDSRNLVAAGKDSLGHVRRFFSWTHNFNSRTDFRSAALMMRTLGYDVERHPRAPEPYSEAEIAHRNACYQRMTGYAVGPHQMYNVKLATMPEKGEAIFTGNVMEALRAAHWKSENDARRNALKFGLRRCLFIAGDKFDAGFVGQWLPEYIRWLHDLPEDAQRRYVDVLFPEHNLPNLGTMFFSYQDNFLLCPFNDRRIIALCAALPVAYRYSIQANRDFLALAAPELCDVPFAEDLRKAS